MTNFKENTSYTIGTRSESGQQAVKVIKRTAKFVTVDTGFMGVQRFKISMSHGKDVEGVEIGSDIVLASEEV